MNEDTGMDAPDTALLLDLMAKARAPIEAQLAATPSDPALLERVANLCRTLGDLDAAARYFTKLDALAPGTVDAGRMARLMTGNLTPEDSRTTRPLPTPFFRRPAFLPTSDRDRIMAYALESEAKFKPLSITANFRDGSQAQRRDTALRDQLGLSKIPELRDVIEPHIQAILPRMISDLDLPEFEIREIHLSMSLTRNAGFGKPHRDDVNSGAMISFLYYFHSQPKQFTGGDLMLYDRQVDPNAAVISEATRFVHADNLLVAFPCNAVHEITRVECPSPEFGHGRFAIAGFVLRAETQDQNVG